MMDPNERRRPRRSSYTYRSNHAFRKTSNKPVVETITILPGDVFQGAGQPRALNKTAAQVGEKARWLRAMPLRHSIECIGAGRNSSPPVQFSDCCWLAFFSRGQGGVSSDVPKSFHSSVAQQPGIGNNCVSSRCSPSSRDTDTCARVNANNRDLLPEETTVLQRCPECSYDSVVRVVGDLKNRSVLILPPSNPVHLVLPVNRICGHNIDGTILSPATGIQAVNELGAKYSLPR